MNEHYEQAVGRYMASQAYQSRRLKASPATTDRRPPKVLLTWESKHGSTADIGYIITTILRDSGVVVTIAAPDELEIDEGFDGYVIGSAVYAGHWMKKARQFVYDHQVQLNTGPVWLFSSGPVGNPPLPKEPPVDVADLTALVPIRDHKIFAGKVTRRALSFPEKAVVMALHVPDGDFRDWDDICHWAAGIAHALIPKEALR